MIKVIQENWRPLFVLVTVVWAVIIYGPAVEEIDSEYVVPTIFGPFVIAMAIYFPFPKRKDK